jgi:C_GCAxxG_C_C family probable redox protein
LAVAETQGIQSDLLPKIATGFCSGVARTGMLCGALSGGIMALGLLTGRNEPGAPVEQHYKKVQELVAQFNDRFGSITCRELTGVHLGTEEGRGQFREKNQIENCLGYAAEVTGLVLALTTDRWRTHLHQPSRSTQRSSPSG